MAWNKSAHFNQDKFYNWNIDAFIFISYQYWIWLWFDLSICKMYFRLYTFSRWSKATGGGGGGGEVILYLSRPVVRPYFSKLQHEYFSTQLFSSKMLQLSHAHVGPETNFRINYHQLPKRDVFFFGLSTYTGQTIWASTVHSSGLSYLYCMLQCHSFFLHWCNPFPLIIYLKYTVV